MIPTTIRKMAGQCLGGLLSLALLAGCSLNPATTTFPTSTAQSMPVEPTPGLQVTLHVKPTHAVVTAVLPESSATPSPAENTATPTPAATLPVSLPQPNSANWVEWVGGLDLPVDIAFLPNFPDSAYILQQQGKIAVVENGKLLSQPVLDLTGITVRSGNEQGLLGIALDPNFPANRYFYLNYTDRNGNTVIARFQASEDFLTADPGSEQKLMVVNQPYPNHNGGGLAFGPDGFLYIALGDGGSANDPQGNGQNLDTLLGKILRIDVSGSAYAIPADNPFAGGGGQPEIWAYGLRNPWRISFDRLTGDLYIADVGQGTWEEVDVARAGSPGGQNYGWNFREGAHDFSGTAPNDLILVDPVAEYSHAEGGCSITGGYVYRGRALPGWQGVYLYADYCTGYIWGLAPLTDGWQTIKLFDTDFSASSFGQDTAGEIYLLDHQAGRVLKLAEK